MKKHISIITLIAVMLTLGACGDANSNDALSSTTEDKSSINDTVVNPVVDWSDCEVVYDTESDYRIVSDGENHYLMIDNEENYSSNGNASVEEPLLTFTSVEEMKDKVLGGKLTENEKQTMSQFRKGENGKIKTLDFSKLCTPALPDGTAVTLVYWDGESYSLTIDTPFADYCNIRVMDSEQYNASFKRDYEDKLLSNPLVHIFKTEQIEERNATVYHYTTSAGEFRDIRYTIEVDGGTLTIGERYCVRRNHDLISVSETIPQRMEIFGEVDGKHFRCLLIDLTERPSVEWISSFGLVELE